MKFFFIITFCFSLPLFAQVKSLDNKSSLPLFEIGAGIFHARVPHYPSASTDHAITLPYPTALYRGDILRADGDGGLRTRFFNSKNLELNLSLGGSLPASSKDVTIRQDMPKLDSIFEFGPGLIWHIIPKDKNSRFKLSLNIPLRVAYSMSFKATNDRGLVFNPLLFGFAKVVKNFNAFYYATYRWANKEFQETFFEVSGKYATQDRPQYSAKKGSVLVSKGLGFTYLHKEKYQGFLVLGHTNYSVNPNRDSPLYQSNHSFTYVIGLTWWFMKSDQMVANN